MPSRLKITKPRTVVRDPQIDTRFEQGDRLAVSVMLDLDRRLSVGGAA